MLPGERDFSGVDLSRVELSYASLQDINLSKANLTDTVLFNSDLSMADLSGAKLDGVKLSGSNMSYVNMRSITCTDPNNFAFMCKVNFTGVDFTGAIFNSRADLNGSHFDRSIPRWSSSPVIEVYILGGDIQDNFSFFRKFD